MVSDRVFYLPPEYSLQTATIEDLARIVYFAAIGHSRGYKIIAILFILTSIFSILSGSAATLLFLIFDCVYLAFCFSWYLSWVNFLNKQMIVVYFVESEKEICGYMRCDTLSHYHFISSLRVAGKYQNQGLGSSIVWHCINNTRKPVYLIAYGSKLKSFYNRLGFINIDTFILPANISSSVHKSRDLMAFRNS